ncbi:MAG TPA: helix-turn-helix domain-containing protein [Solirubrobacteraceae bacterium]|nr:helix-turn-helix domain-containing protein [Solirubrobacteraceae bacterium]HME03078.1 helix-turn-helix domain-containing protein [Solirubrobacteraceae bacterium]
MNVAEARHRDPALERLHKRRDAAANHDRILEAARGLLADGAADGLTIGAVAEAAGVGKATVFRHFGDREGLALALVEGEIRDLLDMLRNGPPPLGPNAPAPERLEAFVGELIRWYTQSLPVAALVLSSRSPDREPIRSLLLHLRTLLQEIDPSLDHESVAIMILSAIGAALVRGSLQPGTDTTDIERAVLALLRGIIR